MRILYRGYTIRQNRLNYLWWISKGNFGVCWADSEAQARKTIDTLCD